MHIHEIEELEYRDGPKLWDADPDVCCAAYQLGACHHTESDAFDDEWERFCEINPEPVVPAPHTGVDAPATEEPF